MNNITGKKILQKSIILFFILPACALFTACARPPELEKGKYTNYKYNFSFEFPENWVRGEKIPGPGYSLHLVSPDEYLGLVISVFKSYMQLAAAPEEWINLVNLIYPWTTDADFEIINKENIILNDGTPAIKAKISWSAKDEGMIGMTSLLALDKKKRRIIFQSTSIPAMPFEAMDSIVNSFRFIEGTQ